MKNKDFNDLILGIKQIRLIHTGKLKPKRKYVYNTNLSIFIRKEKMKPIIISGVILFVLFIVVCFMAGLLK